ncbi:MAG: VanZ family protein [Nitrospirota bacterium]
MKIFLYYYLPVVAWMIFINPLNKELTSESTSHFLVPLLRWLFPLAGQSTIELLHITVRKFTHFFNYAFLAFLLFRAFRMGRRTGNPRLLIAAGVIASLYGGLDEFMQTMIAARTGAFSDWLIDSAGVVCCLGMMAMKKGKTVK